MFLKNIVRKLRSFKPQTTQGLDLAYITKDIVAMCLPARGVRGHVFRNHIRKVKDYLDENHAGKYKVYCLTEKLTYNVSEFEGRVQHYPMPDHNVPRLHTLFAFCVNAVEWLQADPENVIAVHCKAGKGRTGLLICCLLLFYKKYHGSVATVEQAMELFAVRRSRAPVPKDEVSPRSNSNGSDRYLDRDVSTASLHSAASAGRDLLYNDDLSSVPSVSRRRRHVVNYASSDLALPDVTVPFTPIVEDESERETDGGTVKGPRGVENPSQIRWLYEFARLLSAYHVDDEGPDTVMHALLTPIKLYVRKVRLTRIPIVNRDNGCDPYMVIKSWTPNGGRQVYSSKEKHSVGHYRNERVMLSKHIDFEGFDVEVNGEMKFEFWNYDQAGVDSRFCHFWVCSNTIQEFNAVQGSGASSSRTGTYFLSLRQDQLDKAYKDKNHKIFPEGFEVEVTFGDRPDVY